MTMRIVRVALFLCGAALFTVLVIRIGPGAIATSFAQLSWRLPIVLIFPFVLVTIFDTLGWRFAFRRDSVPFGALFATRLAGEAFNVTTPTASVGGEAVKTWLLREHVPFAESWPSVIVAKTTIATAQGLFLLVGILCALPTLATDSFLLRGMEWMLGFEILGVGGFVIAQVSGALGGGGRMLGRLGVLGAGGTQGVAEVDRALAHFYRREPKRLALSVGCHFCGWVASAFETWIILRLLHVPVPFATAVVIEAVGTAVRFATFMVPAHLGAIEGGHVLAFVTLGLEAAAGMSFTLVRRLREAAWVGLGFLVLTAIRTAAPTPATRQAEI